MTMNLQTAFEVTVDDVAAVLRINAAHVANARGVSFQGLAEAIYDEWSGERLDSISASALEAGCELEGQTDAAHAEIRKILVQDGILER